MEVRRIGPEGGLIREIKDLRNRVAGQETGPAGNIVVRQTLSATDPTTGVKTVIGQLPDGSVGFQPFIGDFTPPPVASVPVVSAQPGIFTVVWDGLFVNNADKPRDFEHVNVIGHKMNGTTTVLSTVVGVLRLPTDTVIVTQDVAAIGEVWQFSLESEDYNGNKAERGLRSASATMLSTATDAGVNSALTSLNNSVTAAKSAADSAQNAANAAQSSANSAAADAANAAGIASGKGKVLIQPTAPAAADQLAQNLWIDTTGGANTPKRWDGSAWVVVTDKAATDAAAAAVAAQTKADQAFNNAQAAANAAGQAQTTADGKNSSYYLPSAPGGIGFKVGDTWFDTSNGYRLNTWDGSRWQTTQDAVAAKQAAIDAAAIDAKAKADAAATTAINSQAYSKNASFDDWTGTLPTGFLPWNYGPVKETTLIRRAPFAARFNIPDASSQYGMQYTGTMDHAANIEFYTVEVDLYLVSGTLGGAGMILDWSNSGGNRAQINFAEEISSPTVGKWYRVSKVLRRPNNSFTNMQGYLMGQWDGHGAGAAKEIIYDWLNIRPSTAEEILAYKAPTVGYVDTAKADAIASASSDATAKANAAQSAATSAAAATAQAKADAAQAAATSAAATDAQAKADAAKQAAIDAAAATAQLKADGAKQAAIDAAALTAQSKADAAKQAAIDAAALTAQSKADAAQAAATAAAANDATTKANNAQSAAIAAAATDAAQKATQAKNDAIADATSKLANKSKTYYSAVMPTGGTYLAGDVWIDTANGNKIWVYDGSSFIVAQDTAIDKAIFSTFPTDIDTNAANKWLYTKYDKAGTPPTPQYSDIVGFAGTSALVPDGTNLVVNQGDNYVGQLRTIVNVSAAKTISFTATHDDGARVYVDGVSVYASSVYASGASISFQLSAGWHILDLMWTELGGGDGWFNITPTIGSQVTSMYAPVSNTAVASMANSALLSANGKNKVHYDTADATGTTDPTDGNRPFISGDTWFKRSLTSPFNIIGQWEFVSGAWISRKISGMVLTELDAGTITVGQLTGQQISGTAIDGKTITGPTIQTELAASRGIKLTTTELAGYDTSGAKNFSLTSGGSLTLKGAITSGSTISGALLQGAGIETTPSLLRGVKIADTGITSYDSAGNMTFKVDAATGLVEAPGLKANSIKGDKIEGGSVTADKLMVGDFTNHVIDPYMSGIGAIGGATYAASASTAVSANAPYATLAKLNARDNLETPNRYRTVRGSEVVYAEVWARADNTAISNLVLGVWVTCDDLSSQNWLTYNSTPTLTSYATPAQGQAGWVKLSGTFVIPSTVPNGKPSVKYLPWIQVNGSTGAEITGWYVTGWVSRRQADVTTIADGAITTAKITASGIDGGVITAQTLTGTQMKAKSITVDKLVVTSTDNLVVGADFGNNAASWGLGSYNTYNATAGRGSMPAMRWTGSTAVISSLNLANRVTVDSDNKFRGSIYVKSSAALASATVGLIIRCYTTATAYTDIDGLYNLTPLVANTWTQISGITPALPAGTKSVEFFIWVKNDTTSTITDIDSVTVTRAADGQLVVDGAIDGKTVTGAILRTAVSGSRVIMDASGLRAYDATDAQYFSLSSGSASITGSLNAIGPAAGATIKASMGPQSAWDSSGAVGGKAVPGISFTTGSPVKDGTTTIPGIYSTNGNDLYLTQGGTTGSGGGAYVNLDGNSNTKIYAWQVASLTGHGGALVDGQLGETTVKGNRILLNHTNGLLVNNVDITNASVRALSGSGSVASTTLQKMGNWGASNALTTDSSLVTISGAALDVLTIATAGVYDISVTCTLAGGVTGRSFVEIFIVNGNNARASTDVGEDTTTVTLTGIKLAAGDVIGSNVYQTSGGTKNYTSNLRITKVAAPIPLNGSSTQWQSGNVTLSGNLNVQGTLTQPIRHITTNKITSYPPNSTLWGPGLMSRDPNYSSGDSFISFPANDRFNISETGVYHIDIQFANHSIVGTNSRVFLKNYATGDVIAEMAKAEGGVWGFNFLKQLYINAGDQFLIQFIQESGGTMTWDITLRVTKIQG